MAEILRHKKSGGLYEVLYRGATVETPEPLFDCDGAIVCQRVLDGKIVVRAAGVLVPVNRLQLIGARIQAGAPIANGVDVAVYRSLNGDACSWVRPTSEMDDGRFKPFSVTQDAPASAEAMVDNLIMLAIMDGRLQEGGAFYTGKSAETLANARTALLSVLTPSGGG